MYAIVPRLGIDDAPSSPFRPTTTTRWRTIASTRIARGNSGVPSYHFLCLVIGFAVARRSIAGRVPA